MRKILVVSGVIALALLMAAPVFAADRIITNGVDLWSTPGDGSTFSDFAKEPIPAGFFCSNSAPFTGRIIFKGVRIATADGSLGTADTILQRLDDAVFNKSGVATTRLQMRAMQFESVGVVKTSCGPYKARVTLDGEQPVTIMRIVRDNEKGGRFFAPVYVNVKLSFTPLRGTAREALELRKQLRFPPSTNAQWAVAPPQKIGVARPGFILVDTDSDLRPDTYLPGTSNFAAGWPSASAKVVLQPITDPVDPAPTCHLANAKQHCPVPVTVE